MPQPNILIADIETSPNIGFFWRAGYRQSITPDSIIEERRIICISWKFEHEKRVHHLTWDKDRDDKKMLEKFHTVLEKADMVIAHNGDRFDIPWINTRLLYHGLPPFPKVKTLDTLRECRKSFYLNSNKLDYISQYIGREGKLSVPYSLWKDLMLLNRRKDLKKMVTYCDQDILELEGVYQAIKPYIANTFNLSSFYEDITMCPKCGGHLQKKGFLYTQVGKRQRYKCTDCGSSCSIGKSLTKNQSHHPR